MNQDKEIKRELCDYNCGRVWDEQGTENGFDDCVSAYHKQKSMPNNQPNWEKEIELEFADAFNFLEVHAGHETIRKDIKSFIRYILLSERNRIEKEYEQKLNDSIKWERDQDKLILDERNRLLDKVRLESKKEIDYPRKKLIDFIDGYNQAIKDLEELKKNLKEVM